MPIVGSPGVIPWRRLASILDVIAGMAKPVVVGRAGMASLTAQFQCTAHVLAGTAMHRVAGMAAPTVYCVHVIYSFC